MINSSAVQFYSQSSGLVKW